MIIALLCGIGGLCLVFYSAWLVERSGQKAAERAVLDLRKAVESRNRFVEELYTKLSAAMRDDTTLRLRPVFLSGGIHGWSVYLVLKTGTRGQEFFKIFANDETLTVGKFFFMSDWPPFQPLVRAMNDPYRLERLDELIGKAAACLCLQPV